MEHDTVETHGDNDTAEVVETDNDTAEQLDLLKAKLAEYEGAAVAWADAEASYKSEIQRLKATMYDMANTTPAVGDIDDTGIVEAADDIEGVDIDDLFTSANSED